MQIRKSELNNLNEVWEIYQSCKLDLKDQGINQWNDRYPDKELITSDIRNSHQYILRDERKF